MLNWNIKPVVRFGLIWGTRTEWRSTSSSRIGCNRVSHPRLPSNRTILRNIPQKQSPFLASGSQFVTSASRKLTLFANESSTNCKQHPVFPSGLPSKYWPGSTLLNFSVFNLVTIAFKFPFDLLPTAGPSNCGTGVIHQTLWADWKNFLLSILNTRTSVAERRDNFWWTFYKMTCHTLFFFLLKYCFI